MSLNGLVTPTESRMLAVLADGLAHRREELHACLVDELAPYTNIHIHVCGLRKKLLQRGETIVCEYYGRRYQYRHVKLLVFPLPPNTVAHKDVTSCAARKSSEARAADKDVRAASEALSKT